MMRLRATSLAVHVFLIWGSACLYAQAAVSAAPCGSVCGTLNVAISETVESSAKGLKFERGVLGSRPGDPRIFLLLGSGWLRALTYGDPGKFVDDWLHRHPKSILIPISRTIRTDKSGAKFELVYVWIEDGDISLNVDLVKNGIFQGATMFDMVDNSEGLEGMLVADPRSRALIDEERASAPQDRIERLVSDRAYKAGLFRIEEAERHARAKKLGIWSDAMKDEREAEGIS